MRCAEHPDVETGLTCSRCEKPICYRCLVHTPVGARCRECAQLRRPPTFQVGTKDLLKAAVAAVVVGGAAGGLWGYLLDALVFIPFLPFVAFLGVGYLVGEGVSLSTNRKRATALLMVAVAGTLVAYVAGSLVRGVRLDEFFLWLNPYALLSLAFAAYVAAGRVR